jgi:hypothetical protein
VAGSEEAREGIMGYVTRAIFSGGPLNFDLFCLFWTYHPIFPVLGRTTHDVERSSHFYTSTGTRISTAVLHQLRPITEFWVPFPRSRLAAQNPTEPYPSMRSAAWQLGL